MFLKIASALSLAAALAIPASADVITPGSTANLSQYSASGLTLLATNTPAIVTSSSATFTASYQSGVFTDTNNVFCSGCLDFSYYLANDTGSPQSIVERLTASNFFGFQTAVGYIDNGGITPLNATQTKDGTIGFYFGTDGLAPGEKANYLIIQTNATNYVPGHFSIQDGSTITMNGFQPSAVTPEPSSLILMGTGLLSAAGVARRKFRF